MKSPSDISQPYTIAVCQEKQTSTICNKPTRRSRWQCQTIRQCPKMRPTIGTNEDFIASTYINAPLDVRIECYRIENAHTRI